VAGHPDRAPARHGRKDRKRGLRQQADQALLDRADLGVQAGEQGQIVGEHAAGDGRLVGRQRVAGLL
jgi:hypothetical protein